MKVSGDEPLWIYDKPAPEVLSALGNRAHVDDPIVDPLGYVGHVEHDHLAGLRRGGHRSLRGDCGFGLPVSAGLVLIDRG